MTENNKVKVKWNEQHLEKQLPHIFSFVKSMEKWHEH